MSLYESLNFKRNASKYEINLHSEQSSTQIVKFAERLILYMYSIFINVFINIIHNCV